MPRLALLDPTKTGREAEGLEVKTCHLVVGQEEAIHQVVKAYKTHLKRLPPLEQNLRTALFVAMVVCGNLVGNVLLRAGMRRPTELSALAPMAYLNALYSTFGRGRGAASSLCTLSGVDSRFATLSVMSCAGYGAMRQELRGKMQEVK